MQAVIETKATVQAISQAVGPTERNNAAAATHSISTRNSGQA